MATLQEIQSIAPYEFEKLIAELWETKGYDAEVRKQSKDKGIDIDAERAGLSEKIQVKRYSGNNKIGSNDVREYATIYQQTDANNVVLVTSGKATDSAEELAQDLSVDLIDGEELIHQLEASSVDLNDYTGSSGSESIKDSGVDKTQSRQDRSSKSNDYEVMSYSEQREKAREFSENSLGDIPVARLKMSGTGDPTINCSVELKPVYIFTNWRVDLRIRGYKHHQPHYILTNYSGLKNTNAIGKCSMWITDLGIHWFIRESVHSWTDGGMKAMTKTTWKHLGAHAVDTVEYRKGNTKNRIIINSETGDKYDFFVNKSDPIDESVDYICSEYPNANCSDSEDTDDEVDILEEAVGGIIFVSIGHWIAPILGVFIALFGVYVLLREFTVSESEGEKRYIEITVASLLTIGYTVYIFAIYPVVGIILGLVSVGFLLYTVGDANF